ncbi:MAG: helix-turn-helix transcriptional regulator [Micropepsaceae bacterium]
MYRQYAFATPALRDLVRSAWSVSYADSSESMPGIIAPDAHVEFLFQTGAPCATWAEGAASAEPSPRAMIFGLRHGALRLVPTGENAIVGIRVTPAVASVILGRPLIDCWDRPVPLSTFIGSEADELLEQIAETLLPLVAPLLESWLLGRLRKWDGDDQHNLGLQNVLIWEIAGEPVSTLADQLGFSVRSLRRYCEKYAGLSPKQLVMSGRMLRACASLVDRRDLAISDVANSLGFGDQSAFTNAFRRYVGMTPARLRAEPIVHCERR